MESSLWSGLPVPRPEFFSDWFWMVFLSSWKPFTAHFGEHCDRVVGHPAPPAALRRVLTLWARLHGVHSLELSGHFTGFASAGLV